MLRLPPLALPLLLPALAAQSPRTWIVDNLNRPGAHFTDIQAAVQAVQPGDRLFIRRSTQQYASVFDFQKGVTIEPEGGYVPLQFGGSLTISNIPAGQQFAWLGGLTSPLLPIIPLTITNCQGTVTLEAWQLQPTITDATSVHLNHCLIPGSNLGTVYQIRRSNVFFEDTTNGVNPRGAPRFDLDSSTLYAQGSVLVGQTYIGGPFGSNADAALRLSADSRAVLGDATELYGDTTHPAIEGTGELVVDPSVTLRGSVAPTVRFRTRDLVDLLDLDNDANGARVLGLRSLPNTPHALVFGVPAGSPIGLPGIGDVWLEPRSILPLLFLQTDANGDADTPIPLNLFFTRYHLLGWQALAVPASGAWQISNPVLTYVR